MFSGRNLDIEFKDHWLSSGSGIGEAGFSFVVCQKYVGVELGIGGKTKEDNKKFYDFLFKNKEKIENEFGNKLKWERLDDKKMSRIAFVNDELSVFNEEQWESINQFLTESMINLEKSLRHYINTYSKTNKTKEFK